MFRVDAGTHALTTLATFNGPSGSFPSGGVIADASGNLYGTALNGGTQDAGTVFRIEAGTNAVTRLATFTGADFGAPVPGAAGAYPSGRVIADAAGNLYGTTQSGGMSDAGTIFRLDAISHDLTTLASFTGANGGNPLAGVIADAAGNLYGTTLGGGDFGAGTVFEFDAATSSLTALFSFDGVNGAGPEAGIIVDAAGNLFGTTRHGGAFGAGTVFRLDAITHDLITLVDFDGGNGAQPIAGLTADAAGNLYGTTLGGGAFENFGTVFKLSDAGFMVALTAAPEPATWMTMLCGFGMVGGAMRRAGARASA